jgi:hypothetical protein
MHQKQLFANPTFCDECRHGIEWHRPFGKFTDSVYPCEVKDCRCKDYVHASVHR